MGLALIVIGCATFAFFMVLFFSLLSEKDFFFGFRTHLITTGIAFFVGLTMLGYGFNIEIGKEMAAKADTFLAESKTLSIAGLDYIMHPIDPDNDEDVKNCIQMDKFMDERILFYNSVSKDVYKLEKGELIPYFVNNSNTTYDITSNAIVVK